LGLWVRLLPVLGNGETGQERYGNCSAQHLNLFYYGGAGFQRIRKSKANGKPKPRRSRGPSRHSFNLTLS
jgi:hypothetical protein